MKCIVMFQYSICDMHFGITKSDLILGISVRIFYVFSNRYSSSISARRQILLFANKKMDLVRIEIVFNRKFSTIVRVNIKRASRFLSIFARAISKQQK